MAEVRGFYNVLVVWAQKSLATTYSPTADGSTIGAGGLNFRVRNGNGWDPSAVVTRLTITCIQGSPQRLGHDCGAWVSAVLAVAGAHGALTARGR